MIARARPAARTMSVLAAAGTMLASVAGFAVFAWWAAAQVAPTEPSASSQDAAAGSDVSSPPGDGHRPWARNDDGSPVRWDPCEPIELVVDPEGGPQGWTDLLDEAVARIDAASDLELVVVDEVDERPRDGREAYDRDRYGHRWAPVLVGWASPGESGLGLRSTDRALAVPVAVGTDGDRTFVTGQIVLNAERGDPHAHGGLTPDFADRADSWGAVLLHELLHVVGLDHVDDPAQIMHRTPAHGPVELGDGDLAGLETLTADGCRPAPDPGPVEVSRRDPPARR